VITDLCTFDVEFTDKGADRRADGAAWPLGAGDVLGLAVAVAPDLVGTGAGVGVTVADSLGAGTPVRIAVLESPEGVELEQPARAAVTMTADTPTADTNAFDFTLIHFSESTRHHRPTSSAPYLLDAQHASGVPTGRVNFPEGTPPTFTNY